MMAGTVGATLASLQNVLSWTPYSPEHSSSSPTQELKLPDLLTALPDAARDFRINPLCKDISEASDQWTKDTIGFSVSHLKVPRCIGTFYSETTGHQRTYPHDGEETDDPETLDLMTGLLASMCFPIVGLTELRLCADFLAWIHLLDYQTTITDLSSIRDRIQQSIIAVENEPGSTKIIDVGFSKGIQSILDRLERSSNCYVYDCFRTAILAYLRLQLDILSDTQNESTRNLKSYTTRYRKFGWRAPLFILIEYAHSPKSESSMFQENPAIKMAVDAAADAIIYALDIFECAGIFNRTGSYNISVANSVTVVASEQGLDIPQAIEQVGSLCSERLRIFSALQAEVLRQSSDSPDADTQTTFYVRGLGDCIRGVLHWTLESERYFRGDEVHVRRTLVVEPAGGGSHVHDDTDEEL